MIQGSGPAYAKRMVKIFGDKVFDIIEPDRLKEVDGIGPIRLSIGIELGPLIGAEKGP